MSKFVIDIELEARRVLDEYKARRFSGNRMPYHTRLEEAGVELDVVRCYLSGFTISEIVRFLAMERNCLVSKSVIGRFYRDLFLNKIYPVKRRLLQA